MRGTSHQAEDDATEDVRVEGLLSLAFLEGLAPVGGGELEDAVAGPARKQAEQVTDVRQGLDPVQAAAGQERDEGGVDLASVVAANEEPIFSADAGGPSPCTCPGRQEQYQGRRALQQ